MGNRSKFKIQRRLNVELPGLGKPGALDKRNYGPGQHGQRMRRKVSDYGIR
ncbi:MAG: 30S ribosomal protein S4, partial [candidate division Zixibacteria bacterium]|nr:30S ribosomal protein S4 [candidate division Zixibacteria bacterium]